jgi:SPRY domain-containing SOCS box protein 3
MMFGIGTRKARLHVNSFTNLLGEDENGWGLSHKGLIWHGGVAKQFCNRFKENEATKIGILYDGIAGTLTYYKDDICLGVAFRGLNDVRITPYLSGNSIFEREMLLKLKLTTFIHNFPDPRTIISNRLLDCR